MEARTTVHSHQCEEANNLVDNLQPHTHALSESFRWNELPDHVKLDVLRYLPFPTLRSFLFLSKKSHLLASMIKCDVRHVALQEFSCKDQTERLGVGPGRRYRNSSEGRMRLTIEYANSTYPEKSYNTSQIYTIYFVSDGAHCIVTRGKGIHSIRQPTISNVRYRGGSVYCAAFDAFFHMMTMLKSRTILISLNTMSSEMEHLLMDRHSSIRLNCKMFDLVTRDARLAPKLLHLIAPGCALRFRTNFQHEDPVYFGVFTYQSGLILQDPAIFRTDVIRFASSIGIEWFTEVGDDEIIQLKASCIYMRAPKVSSRAISRMLLDWCSGRREIIRITLLDMREAGDQEIIRNIDRTSIVSSAESEIVREKARQLGQGFHICFGVRNVTNALLLVTIEEKLVSLQGHRARYLFSEHSRVSRGEVVVYSVNLEISNEHMNAQ